MTNQQQNHQQNNQQPEHRELTQVEKLIWDRTMLRQKVKNNERVFQRSFATLPLGNPKRVEFQQKLNGQRMSLGVLDHRIYVFNMMEALTRWGRNFMKEVFEATGAAAAPETEAIQQDLPSIAEVQGNQAGSPPSGDNTQVILAAIQAHGGDIEKAAAALNMTPAILEQTMVELGIGG